MKQVICPKCEHRFTFDDTRYSSDCGVSFICPRCRKRFVMTLAEVDRQNAGTMDAPYGSITVLENSFCERQEFPLRLGENTVGRRSPGTEVEISIVSGDMSMDRRHCVLTVKEDKQGGVSCVLRDFPSITGTFLRHEILADRDRIRLRDGDVVTMGATTFIVHLSEEEDDGYLDY